MKKPKRKSAVERLAEDIEGSARVLTDFYLAALFLGVVIAGIVVYLSL